MIVFLSPANQPTNPSGYILSSIFIFFSAGGNVRVVALVVLGVDQKTQPRCAGGLEVGTAGKRKTHEKYTVSEGRCWRLGN